MRLLIRLGGAFVVDTHSPPPKKEPASFLNFFLPNERIQNRFRNDNFPEWQLECMNDQMWGVVAVCYGCSRAYHQTTTTKIPFVFYMRFCVVSSNYSKSLGRGIDCNFQNPNPNNQKKKEAEKDSEEEEEEEEEIWNTERRIKWQQKELLNGIYNFAEMNSDFILLIILQVVNSWIFGINVILVVFTTWCSKWM